MPPDFGPRRRIGQIFDALGESLMSEGLESAVPVAVASIARLSGERDDLIPFFGVGMAMLTGFIFERAHSASVGIVKSHLVGINTIWGSIIIVHGSRELLTSGRLPPERAAEAIALISINVVMLLGAHVWEEHQAQE